MTMIQSGVTEPHKVPLDAHPAQVIAMFFERSRLKAFMQRFEVDQRLKCCFRLRSRAEIFWSHHKDPSR